MKKTIISSMIILTLFLTSCSFWDKKEEVKIPETNTGETTPVETKKIEEDKIINETVDGITLSGVVLKNIDNKEIKVFKLNKGEKIEDYIKRTGIDNLDYKYITQYELYVNSKMNGYSVPEISFMEKNISVEFDKDYNIVKVNKLNKKTITKEQFLEKNKELKEQILVLNEKMKIETNKQQKDAIKSQIKSLIDGIPTVEIVKEEFKMDKYPTFMELIQQLSITK